MSISFSAIRGLLLATASLISVPQLVAITISPVNPTVTEAAQQQFTSSVAATWKTSCDSISSGGLFTASVYPGSCTVTATATDGSGSATSVVNVVSPIVMTPQYATTPQNKTQQFTANMAVTWSENTANCGSITSGGLYTASGAVGSRCTIEGVATSSPHYTVWGSDNIVSSTSSGFAIAPLNPSIATGGTIPFSANAPASWKTTCGTISTSGVFTAPASAASCTVTGTATSGGQSASTTVTVTSSSGTFSISPTSATVNENATQQFTASAAATWTASCGTITSGGLFTANLYTNPCTVTATATSGGATASAVVTTVSPIVMTPVTANTQQNQTQQFTASMPVTWSAKCGSITSGGLFTASAAVGSKCTIEGIATSSPHYTVWGGDTIVAASSFTVSPSSVSVNVGATQQFTASAAATWAASCGSVSSSGLFTAPSTTGTCTITATNSSGTKATATATVTSSSFTVSPTSVSLNVGATQQFTASAAATWAASCGSISSSGLFTAPSTTGTCTITATNSSGTKATATATITSAAFAVSPTTATVNVGGTQQFTANAAATWATSCGSISSSGLFTAPSTTGTCTITATNSSGTKATATATVTSASFTVTPKTVSLSVNSSTQFSASASATWAASCGSISSGGLYSAPSTTGTCTITATSSSGATATATATITSAPTGTGFVIYPTSTYMLTGTQQTFQGQFTNNAPDSHPVTFTVDGIVGGTGTMGTITSAGVYTAPNATGSHTVTARDTTTGASAKATVSVYSQVAADFGSRTSTAYPVPAYLLGAERMDNLYHQSDLDMVTAAGVKTARFYAQIPIVFKTQTPVWSSIDSTIRKMQASGVHVLLQMHQSPPWLQTATTSSCKGTAAPESAPSDVNAWGKMAAQYVAHMDATFPGVVTDYEIWNEPNTGALCGLAVANKLSFYQTLFAAAAPLMEAQAAADHATIRVGGPATAGLQNSWIQALLSNPNTAPYMQFVSYHDYMYGSTGLGAQWNTYNGIESVYQQTQNSGAGPLYRYVQASNLVKAGKQPLGSQLPIYNTEYNMNWAFAKDCCRNDYTLSPIFNGIYVADSLNAVYSGTPTGIGKMIYFAANANPYFCLIGIPDANMDCAYNSTTPAQPYPEYFLYQLFFGSSYLNLESGGHMAKSITPGNSGGQLVVTAFYNASQDAIVIINPTPASFSQVNVSLTNIGSLPKGTATLYQIMGGRSISGSSLSSPTQGASSYSTTIPVGPYSVQAISLQ